MNLKEIKAAINTLLIAKIDAEVIAYRVEEDIPRPSLKVFFSDIKSSPGMGGTAEKNVIVRIYYYPTNPDDCDIEILEVSEKLSDLFSSYTKVGEEVLTFLEYDSDHSNDMIQASFEVEYSTQVIEDPDYPMMDNIDMDMKEGE
ncbi:hypothetical protein EZV73_26625 [Acidaminobacter sp. JC074]|uniref:phage tail terminator family protein n=1 Tax=Acidaminobacter sp. JC074 TaxID=2530199 RepID=UPI001F10A9AC|nr:hypothetical protein [Acidaminobacter sp. JC074]MCH4891182.1 hypothetical protein [Acidaminobacter sp. JC074]